MRSTQLGRPSDRLPDAATFVAVKEHLQGLARHWFLELPAAQRSTYDIWRSSFVNQQLARRNAQQELLLRRQGPQETIGDFAVASAQLSKRADPEMGARDIVENFVSKLADAALMNLLRSRTPATLHDAVSIATEHVARMAAREATTMRTFQLGRGGLGCFPFGSMGTAMVNGPSGRASIVISLATWPATAHTGPEGTHSAAGIAKAPAAIKHSTRLGQKTCRRRGGTAPGRTPWRAPSTAYIK